MRKKNIIEEVTLDYLLLYFITGLNILIVNYLFILHINLLDECQNIEKTTPRDYAVLIHGVPKPVDDNSMIDEVLNVIREVSYYKSPLQVYQVIPCLRISEIINIAKEKFVEETKLYHIKNFEKQKKLNEIYGFNQSENNLHYFKEILCVKRKTSIENIKIKILELEK
jgi:hypothetical protein